ncbi:hypothetical protein Poly51_29810 [Rubripirellula tenax]|uniref:Uncharacterized protein n=1 Tax=Rubripirellula tenax TaxID=2528015 RepID=A0A5C6F908_9BACT|nr:hypothetical protein [Rubripirellula tenax]TWU57060.1 hypothetical protein Poly51_29810 [Rubripirellula tenax]
MRQTRERRWVIAACRHSRPTLHDYDPEAELSIALGAVIEHDRTVLTYRNLKVKRLPEEQD